MFSTVASNGLEGGERVYREKLRLGIAAGIVLDLSSAADLPWSEAAR